MKTSSIDLDELFSFEEVAAQIKGSRRQVEEAAKRGELERISLGTRCVRITKASVEAYLARRGK